MTKLMKIDFLFRQVFMTIPDELLESARLDGAGPMKFFKDFLVPLSPQAVKIIEEMKQFSGPDGYIFTQKRDPQKPISENALLYFSNRLGYARSHTIHGFRTIASSYLHESMLWNSDVIEKQMSHLVGSKVSRAYNKAEHLEERRKMLNWWSDYIYSLKN